MTGCRNLNCLSVQLCAADGAVGDQIIVTRIRAGRLNAVFLDCLSRSVTRCRNLDRLSGQLFAAVRAVNDGIIVACFRAGRLNAVFLDSRTRSVLVGCRDLDRLSVQLCTADGAVNDRIIVACFRTGRLNAVFFDRLARSVTRCRNLDRLSAQLCAADRAVNDGIIVTRFRAGRLNAVFLDCLSLSVTGRGEIMRSGFRAVEIRAACIRPACGIQLGTGVQAGCRGRIDSHISRNDMGLHLRIQLLNGYLTSEAFGLAVLGPLPVDRLELLTVLQCVYICPVLCFKSGSDIIHIRAVAVFQNRIQNFIQRSIAVILLDIFDRVVDKRIGKLQRLQRRTALNHLSDMVQRRMLIPCAVADDLTGHRCHIDFLQRCAALKHIRRVLDAVCAGRAVHIELRQAGAVLEHRGELKHIRDVTAFFKHDIFQTGVAFKHLAAASGKLCRGREDNVLHRVLGNCGRPDTAGAVLVVDRQQFADHFIRIVLIIDRTRDRKRPRLRIECKILLRDGGSFCRNRRLRQRTQLQLSGCEQIAR